MAKFAPHEGLKSIAPGELTFAKGFSTLRQPQLCAIRGSPWRLSDHQPSSWTQIASFHPLNLFHRSPDSGELQYK